jgi:phytanoyl-CoA hydroxylase
MITQEWHQARSQFDTDGFATVRSFVSREEVDEINGEIERYIADVIPTLPPEQAFYEIKGNPSSLKQLPRLDQHDEYFRQFHRHPRMGDLAAHLLGCDVVGRDLQWFNKPPELGKPTPAHQDGFYDKIEPIEMVNMWLALDPADEQNGCVRYVAGSFKRGLREHTSSGTLGFSQGIADYGPDDWAREVRLFAEPGDAIAHHCMTIHRADPNDSTTRSRVAMVMVYRGSSAKVDEAWHARHHEEIRRQHEAMGRTPTV